MLEKEYEFYLNNKQELISKYNNRFIAIKGEEVLGDYDSKAEAVRETVKNHEMGTFLVQKISDKEEPEIKFHSRVYG